jgi:hypothetical protein
MFSYDDLNDPLDDEAFDGGEMADDEDADDDPVADEDGDDSGGGVPADEKEDEAVL